MKKVLISILFSVITFVPQAVLAQQYESYSACMDAFAGNVDNPQTECCKINSNWPECKPASVPPPNSCQKDADCNDPNKVCNLFKSQCELKGTGGSNPPAGGSSGGTNGGSSSEINCPTQQGYIISESGLCIPKPPISGGLASTKTLPELILAILKIMLTLAGVIAVVYIIIGGYLYITAGGNDEQAEKGKKALLNAVIGIVVVILAFAIVQIITNAVTKDIVF